MKHAFLSASSSNRWINCPPSARLCETYTDTASEYAREGTQAHELAEYKSKAYLGDTCKNPIAELDLYNAEMEGYVADYVSFVTEQIEAIRQTGKEVFILVEHRVDFSDYVIGGFGTADVLIIADGIMQLIDLKYGKGHLVSAFENSQLMLYALGAMSRLNFLFDFETVKLTIYQPRMENVDTYETTAGALEKWADEVLRPAAELADAGDGSFAVGDWCSFCRAKNECRARAEHNLELAKYAFKEPPLLETWEIAEILQRTDELVSWASGIKKYAYQAALSGTRWPGMKLVRGRSNRKITDEVAAEKALLDVGCYDIYDLKSLTALEDMFTKKRVAEMLGTLIVKPPGKPVLAPESDKRQEISVDSAAEVFADADDSEFEE